MLLKSTKGRVLKIAFFSLIFIIAIFLLPNFSQSVNAQVETGIEYADGIGLSDTDPRLIIAKIIRVVLGFLGIIALVLILYAGWLYMTSGGDSAKVDKAKKILSNALIGLIIILSAFAIATFIINYLNRAVSGTGANPRPPSSGIYGGIPSSGNRIIESHYPERDQTGVPRNTSIVVTFKEPMNVAQMIKDDNGSGTYGDWIDNGDGQMQSGEYDTINPEHILIYKNDDGTGDATLVKDVFVNVMPDGKTFRFKPVDYLGSPSEEIWYSVSFSSQLEKGDGTDAFPGVVGALGYTWTFLVSTVIDLTPPRVLSVIPFPASSEPRNVVVQINFNEAINPISASGASLDGFENIVIKNLTDSTVVDGNFYISNQYRTVEFLTEDLCGRNSCGNDVFCLPAMSNIEALVKASELVLLGEPSALYPFNGTVDMADNSLDGNKNGQAEGPESQSGTPPYNQNLPEPENQGDDYRWDFNTTAEILLSPPSIDNIYPNFAESEVALNSVPTATFNRLMMSSSMKKHALPALGSVAFYSLEDIPFWLTKSDDFLTKKTTVEIRHSPFSDFSSYTPEFNFRLKDIYQNCYYPSAGQANDTAPICTPNPPSQPYCCDGNLSTESCN